MTYGNIGPAPSCGSRENPNLDTQIKFKNGLKNMIFIGKYPARKANMKLWSNIFFFEFIIFLRGLIKAGWGQGQYFEVTC